MSLEAQVDFNQYPQRYRMASISLVPTKGDGSQVTTGIITLAVGDKALIAIEVAPINPDLSV